MPVNWEYLDIIQNISDIDFRSVFSYLWYKIVGEVYPVLKVDNNIILAAVPQIKYL